MSVVSPGTPTTVHRVALWSADWGDFSGPCLATGTGIAKLGVSVTCIEKPSEFHFALVSHTGEVVLSVGPAVEVRHWGTCKSQRALQSLYLGALGRLSLLELSSPAMP